MVTLPPTIKAEVERPQQQNAHLWLVEITLDRGDVGVPPVLLRICDGGAVLDWPLSNPTTQLWQPFSFAFSPIEQTNEGDLTSIDLSVDNAARTLMKFLHDGNGCEGNPVRIFLVPKTGLALAYPNHEAIGPIKAVVAAAGATDEAVTFRLSLPNFFNVSSPADRYTGQLCRWDYGGSICGYVLNGFALFPTCPKTIGACIERGADLVARGLPAVLPGNFGGKPGIARQRA